MYNPFSNRRPRGWLFGLALMLTPIGVLAETLEVGILNNSGTQRSFYTAFARQFEQRHPGIQVEFLFKNDADYKASLGDWFARGEGPQVLNWQGGERLFQYVRQGYVASISGLWQSRGLSDTFTVGAQGAVTWEEARYGIPISYYQWGFYYRKSLFEELNLAPPQNWEEFLAVCARLKREGIVPITMGATNHWPTAAWFDYFNLRINGLEFHQRLLKGEIPFTDPRVADVFEKWKLLLDRDYFVPQYTRWEWAQAMPFLYHKMAGMTLIGNFFAASMPPALKDDFDYFAFPRINPEVPIYEEAPLDIFMIPAYAQGNPAAEKFLLAVADAEFQSDLNSRLGMISPNTRSQSSDDYFIRKGAETLDRAQGLSQFFDRDTSDAMAQAATRIFSEFMASRDIEQTLSKLERARQAHLR